ncbi:MAG: zonular occludens toxin [Comamonas sp.]|uniref:zonular occludens toxin domain-containing protein n=1 Tax=Comamonas sp. TaxID=34028 RepID=UPI0026489020|nr:zonular occludens toxin domain-containing protein [Comamonas sp.]MDN5506771.1 zonular occludens toxin [Comamonas sp.]MDN5539969.1 zonular occludens toxin [Comamonas sp.]
MPVYVVQGKLGTGKGKYCMLKMHDALLDGRRVATNFDLFLDGLMPSKSKVTAVRVPDKPTAQDLDDIGPGNPEDRFNEERNGVLVLDELGSWLNSRGFNSPERAALLDWLIHARKKGWDVYLVVQSIDMIDKQVRVGLAEYQVRLIRADKIKLPIVGSFLGKRGRLPKLHIANVSLTDVPGVTIDREWFKGEYLHKGYDTLQIFRDWVRNPVDERFKSELYGGPYSMLSAWHLKGRYEVPEARVSLLQRLFGGKREKPVPKPRLAAVELCAKLPPDEAWALARRYVQGGV